MPPKIIPTQEQYEKIQHYYYKERLSIKETATLCGLKPDVVKRILNTEFKGVRSPSTSVEIGRTRFKEKYKKSKEGEKNPLHKLTTQEVLDIREKYHRATQTGKPKTATQERLAEEYQVSFGTIRDIIYRATWKHL